MELNVQETNSRGNWSSVLMIQNIYEQQNTCLCMYPANAGADNGCVCISK